MKRAASITARALLVAGACLPITAGLVGCRGDRSEKPPRQFFPDMDYQPRWHPQGETDFFVQQDGTRRTQRTPPANTVAYGEWSFDSAAHADAGWADGFVADQAALVKEDDAFYRGRTGPGPDAPYLEFMPVEVTPALIERGQERFNIYCAACHGYLSDGNGMVGARWSYPPANLLGELYRDRSTRQGQDGYLFEVIREGVWAPDGANRMPGYKHAVNEQDAWAIVAYLRVLQKSQNASAADLSPADRDRLNATVPAAGGMGGDQ